MSDEEEFDSRVEALKVISLKSSWTICKVTRLQNLQFSPVKLKKYALLMKDKLASPDSLSAKMIKVNIVPHSDLKLNIEDPDALQILVYTKGREEDEFKVTCECILMSWGTEEVNPQYTSLPLLFTRGQKSIVNDIKQTLNSLFGCFFTKTVFTTKDLIVLFAVLVKSIPMRHEQSVDLSYQLANAETKHSLIVSNRVIDLHRLWRCLVDLNAEDIDFDGDDVLSFYSYFQNMMMDKFELDLTMFNLVEVKYPGLTIKTNSLSQCSDPVLLSDFLNAIMKIIL